MTISRLRDFPPPAQWIIFSIAAIVLLLTLSIPPYLFLQISKSNAINRIETLGGSVFYDVECLIIDLNDTPTTDNDLRFVHRLKPTYSLHLRNTQITDDGLRLLQNLRLAEIELVGANLSNAALQEYRISAPNCLVIR